MDFSKNISKYLVEKGNMTRLVILTALFSLFFINMFQPYGSRDWIKGGISESRYFMLSSALVLLGMCIVAVSRVILYKFCKRNKRTIALWAYLVWIALEILCVAFSFTVLEITIFDDSRPFVQLLKTSFGNTAWILLMPYSVLWLYFSWRDKDKRLRAISDYRSQQEAVASEVKPMITFYDNRNELKCSVKQQDLLYVSSHENNLYIHYKDGNKISQTIMRGTYKAIEDDLKSRGIIRCHRSYMVNRQYIKYFEKSKENGYHIILEAPGYPVVPVSKNYVSTVFELFE